VSTAAPTGYQGTGHRGIWRIERVSPIGVMRVWLIVALILWIVVSVAAAILWGLGGAAGLVDNVESFWAEATGQESVTIDAGAVILSVVAAGFVLVVLGTVFVFLVTIVVNAILELTGGIKVRLAEQVSPPRT